MSDGPVSSTPRDLSRLGSAAFDRTAQEHLMTDLAESLPGAVFQLESDRLNNLRYNFVSGRVREVLGVTPEAIRADPLLPSKLVIGGDSAVLFRVYRESARDRKPVSADVRIRRPDGQLRWIRTFATSRMAGGNRLWDGYWNDVTAEVEARDQLERSEARLRAIVDTVPGVLFQLRRDADGSVGINYLSRGSEQMSGLTREELCGDFGAFLRVVHEQDRALINEALEGSVSEMKVKEITVRVHHRDGSMHWIRNIVSPRRSEDGQVLWDGISVDMTEHKRTEAALAQVERRLHGIMASAPGAVYQLGIGSDGRVRLLYVSEGLAGLVGVDRAAAEEDIGRLFALVLPEDLPGLQQAIGTVAERLEVISSDFRFRHAATGEVRWIRSRAAPQRLASGEVLCSGFWQDITDIKTLESELRAAHDQAQASAQQLRVVTDSLPGMVYQYHVAPNLVGTYTMVSDQGPEMFGRTREWITGTPNSLLYLVVEEDRPRLIGAFIEAVRSGGNVDFTYRSQLAGDRVGWLRTRARPIAQADGGVAWSGFTMEVTTEIEARQQFEVARDAAESAQQRIRAIFDHTRIGLVMIDADHRFSDANPSLRELLEIEDQEQFTREFPRFSPPLQPDGRDSMEKAAEVIATAFERGYNRFDWMHQTISGDPRPCEIALTRVELAGRPMIFATMTDMRERLRYEAELRQASEEARSASRAKSDFLANMSHEIRTPMNAIVGLTHLGLSSEDPGRLRDYLGKIDTAAKSLLQIINDILDFSKIEAGKLSLESTPFDLYAVLDNLSGMLNLRAAEKGLELLFAVEPGICAQLVGDPLRLGQVLLNLTGNAVKFTEQGQIVVRVTTAKKGRDFVRLRFEVSDTGIGLTRGQIEHLFESFSQADSSTTRRFGGTGLGLTISQRLVDLMDGEIAVDSSPGQGSSFYFTARFRLAPAAARRTLTPHSLRGMQVLVVDDNSTAQAILRAYLESFGFGVHTASDGPRAIEAITRPGAPDFRLVLMDWQMPGMDGIEAARRIRRIVRPEPAVIIMVTAFGREEVERQALSTGLDGFLIKPVNPSVLLDTILDAFGKEAVLDPARAGALASRIPEIALPGRQVLLVEDNPINQEVAMELLQRMGIRVDLATDGREAVERAAGADYDAILMDVQMPVMDGLEATRCIRRLGSPRAAVPVIAMTANAMAEDRQRCLEAGMNDHVGKPVDVARLREVLAQWIAGPAAAAPVTAVAAPPGRGRQR